MVCAKSLHIWLFKVIHSKMVRWVQTDGQGLAAAAAGCIYRYYHPACNAGDLCWKHDIMLPRGYDITSKMNTDMIKTLRLLAKHYFSCSFLVTRKIQLPHVRSDVESFLQTQFREQLWAHCNRHNQPASLQLPTGFISFDKLITECANWLFLPSLGSVDNKRTMEWRWMALSASAAKLLLQKSNLMQLQKEKLKVLSRWILTRRH